MNVNLFAYSRKGCELALKVADHYMGSRCFASPKFADGTRIQPIDSTYNKVREVFQESDLIVFIGACGIAVRSIAPVVVNKVKDPAVLVIDDKGQYIIPILSGHIGGANKEALYLAKQIHAIPIITTATDINCRFSVDSWAISKGLRLSSLKMAREISSEILEHDLAVTSDYEMEGSLPNGLYEEKAGTIGIYITHTTKSPYQKTLRILPKVLHLGIGCRKGIEFTAIKNLVFEVFSRYQLDFRSVAFIASIDVKKEEAGLLSFQEVYHIPLRFYTAEQLGEVKGEFSASSFVKDTVGVDNVCERSAVLSSHNGKIIVSKTANNGVTVAVAVEDYKISW